MIRLLRTLAAATVAELALAGALAGLLAVGGRWNGWLDVFAAFAPVWLAFSLVGAALAWPALEPGSRRIVLIVGLVGVAANGALMAPEFVGGWVAAPASRAAPTLKLLTFNVWDDNRNPNETVDAILRADADVVTLQEIGGLGDAGLARLQRVYPYRASCPPGCGMVMLSKHPWAGGPPLFTQIDAHDLAIWSVTTAPDGAPVQVLTTHYVWPVPPGAQAAQRAALARIIGGLDKRGLIVAGDFNLPPWTAALRRQDALLAPLQRRTHGLLTWPATIAVVNRPAPLPFLAIDQIYAGPVWRTLSIGTLPRAGSDHYGVLITLQRDPPQSGLVPKPNPAQR